MSSTEDLIFLSTHQLYWASGLSFVGLFFISLKGLFGSYSIPRILREYSKTKHVDNTYEQMHRSRENFCYHIGAARERGELDDAKRLARELQELDKQIGEMERTQLGRRS